MRYLSRNERNIVTIAFTIVLVVINLSIQKLLPDKYFYDSTRILNLALSGEVSGDRAYDFAASFYRFFNIFNFKTLIEWNFFIPLIGNLLILIIVLKYNVYKNRKIYYFFLFPSLFLVNLYVFTISKDFIQFIIYLIIFIILSSEQKNIVKYFFVSILLIPIAYIFRLYLILIPILMMGVYFFLFKIPYKSKYKFFFRIIMVILLGAMFLYILKVLNKDIYMYLVDLRSSLNMYRIDSEDARTMILDIIPNENYNVIIYIFNYILNLLRLLFPFELIYKFIKYFSISYIPFLVFQFFVSFNLMIHIVQGYKGMQKDKKLLLLMSFVISFYLISALFEPDFGSFLKHEMAIFPYLYFLIFSVDNKELSV